MLPLTCDARPRKERPGRRNPVKTWRAERDYARALKNVGVHTGNLINAFEAGDGEILSKLLQLLQSYAEALIPWARFTATKMLMEVNARDQEAWRKLGKTISVQLHHDIANTPVGEQIRWLLDEQVGYITSIPLEAAKRVQELTIQGLEDSSRGEEIIDMIMQSGLVAEHRAVLIARTETAKASFVLSQVRAEQAGCTHYIWRTVKDASVREGHREMEGKVCEYADPPLVNEGHGRVMKHHPGMIWNCRCYAEPVIPKDYD